MKKILILVLVSVIILGGCSKESEIWNSVVNKEFSNLDIWAGNGFYFHEENKTQYCTFMIYGSGVNVAGYYTSEIEFEGENKMIISLPYDYTIGFFVDESGDEQGMRRVELVYNIDTIFVNDYEFTIYEGFENYKYIIKKIE